MLDITDFNGVRESRNYKMAIETMRIAVTLMYLNGFQASEILALMFSVPKEITIDDIVRAMK